MSAQPDEIAAPSPTVSRVEAIRCQTHWCRNVLGIRLPGGTVRWDHCVRQDYQTGETHVTCPTCGAERTWRPR